MIEEEEENFILILSDIGKNSEGSEYLFRIMKVVVEMPLPEFFEKY
jgi:hypothetical protein